MGLLGIGLLVGILFTLYATGQGQSYKCDFEGGPCSFLANAKTNIVNWKPGRGKLNAQDTGPAVDHTYGNASGNYMYVNVTAAKTNAVSLETTVPLKDGYCVRFFYHMYGADIGDLKVTVESKSVSTDYFRRSKTQGDRWKEAFFSVTATNMMKKLGYKVMFTAKHQSATKVGGDIALDDIELTPGKCPDSKREATQLCTFDDYDCGYTSTRKTSLNWLWKSFNGDPNYLANQPKEDHTLGTSAGGYWYAGISASTIFGGSFQSAYLTSPLYKAPGDPHSCLHFYYYMDGDGKHFFWEVEQAYLQAHLTFPNSKTGGQWLTTKAKNMTNHRQWTYVEAKANIKEDYRLQFTVGFEGKAAALIAIDDVKIIQGNCPESGDCDFEEDMCSWTDGGTGYSWLRKTGDSRTNREIGPATDNTKGTGKGNYVVFSTKNKNFGSVAVLESGFYAPEDASKCLSFYYQMSGDDPGTLKIIRREQMEEQIAETTVWSLKGDQGPGWKKGMVLLQSSTFMDQVVFFGITGKGKNGFMALDDIKIRTGEECKLTPPYADPRYETMDLLSCSFDDKSLCSWEQDQTNIKWKFGGFEEVKSTTPKKPANNQGYYIYVSSYEGVPQTNHELVSRIKSPVVSASFNVSSCFSFYYNMFGASVGELTLSIVALDGKGEPLGKQVIWRRSGTQPDRWFQYKDTMGITEGDYRVEIQGEMGPGFSGYFAIDDISLVLGACPNTEVCDFERGLCGWTIEASKEGKFLWRRTVPTKLGPPRDHTSMTGAGYYLQAVSEGDASSNEVSNLVSPKYGKRWGAHCLTFWYWRPGQGNGSLSVLTRKGNGEETQLWLEDKDVGMFWHFAQVTVDVKEEVQVLIRAIKGSSEANEMALDDIHIKNSRCGNPGSCSFNRDYCGYFLDAMSDFAWQLGDGRVVDDMKVDSTPQDNSVENGMYVYADMTSPVLKEGHYSMLVSEIINAPRQGTFCLTFFYHMNGKDNCSLSVGKALLENTGNDMLYKTKELFKLNDNFGERWKSIGLNVPAVWGALQQVYFQATRGSGPRAFLAVDDVTIVDGMCEAPTTSPPVTVTEMPVSVITCDFDKENFCSWTLDKTQKLTWKISNPGKLEDGMPKFDHTKGNYFGRYAYLKGDGLSAKTGRLISVERPKEWSDVCLSFWYFMDGEWKDRLTVETRSTYSFSRYSETIWSREGNYGYKWRHAYVAYKKKKFNNVQFAIAGMLKTGIIAIDDLAANGGSCPPSSAAHGCGDHLNARSGSFQSLDIDSDGLYEPNLDCRWTVFGDSDDLVYKITFERFDLEPPSNSSCIYDYVELREDNSPDGGLIGRYCGSSLPAPIITSGNRLSVLFHSDEINNRPGFKLNFESIPSPCGTSLLLVDPESPKTLTSPNYPGAYPANLRCKWTIIHNSTSLGPESWIFNKVHLTFTDFDVPCNGDYVQVQKIRTPKSPEGLYRVQRTNPFGFVRLCGPMQTHDVIAQSGMVMSFQSVANSQSAKGFSMTYKEASCNRTYTSDSGVVASSRYSAHSDVWYNSCNMKISVSPGKTISAYFSHLQLYDVNGTCSLNSFKVYDGPDKNSRPIGTYCGNEAPNPVFSSGNALYFESLMKYRIGYYYLIYMANDQDRGCGGSIYAEEGTISSPLYPQSYQKEAECIWYITVPGYYSASVEFKTLVLNSTSGCDSNYVELYDGHTGQASERVARYCGTDNPGLHVSRSNQVMVKFKSDANNQGPGFLLNFKSTPFLPDTSLNFIQNHPETQNSGNIVYL